MRPVTRRAFADPRLGIDTQAIRQWRILWSMTGLPSGYDDFYKVNGICMACRGFGRVTFGADRCEYCEGTGRAGLFETMVHQRHLLSALEEWDGDGSE